MYKPNLNLPLASSYNERGVAGFTHTQTNSENQRKINCFYEISKNSVTGQGKLALTKRPGVTINATSFGVSTQSALGICTDFFSGLTKESLSSSPIVFVQPSGATNKINAIGASANSSAASISSGAAIVQIFIDKTFISNVETIVLQTRQTSLTGNERVFFSGSSVGAAWTEITDADFTGNIAPPSNRYRGKIVHMDGFAFQLLNNNSVINSDLNSLSSWTATNFINKLIMADPPVGLAKLGNQLLAFGENTVEAFYNAGNATGSPLSSIKQLATKIGMVRTTYATGGSDYYCLANRKIYFIGRRAGGSVSMGLFSYNGSIFEKVSPSFVDKIIGENVSNDSYFLITSFGFNGQQAIGISFTACTASGTHRWLMYFPDWNDWFEWNSTVFDPMNAGEYFLGITPNQHRVYNFTASDNWQDDGTSFSMQTQFSLPQDGHQRKRMAEFGVLADTARATNMLSVEFSDDDYVSFINIGAIDLARDIKTLNRGGSYRQRAVRLSSTNALETRLSAFVARIE